MASSERSLITTVVRRVLPLTLLGVTLLALLRRAYDPLINPDTLFHLRFGAEFLSGAWRPWATGHVGTFEHGDWVPTQWLSQVAMAWSEEHFGLAGVTWLQGLLFVLIVAAMFVSARRRASLLVSAALVPLAVLAMLPNFAMRPQLVSFGFMALTVIAWQRAGESRRPPWLLIPLAWVWAMCHGMWPLGVAYGLLATLGIALDSPAGERRRTVLRLGLVPVLACVAALCTPVGPRLLGGVLLVNDRGHYFSEWAPPDFTQAPQLCLLAMLAIVVLARLRSGASTWFDSLMVLTAIGFSVYSSRTVPIAAICLVPLAATSLTPFVEPATRPTRRELLAVSGTFLATFTAFTLVLVARGVPALSNPAWADRELAALPPGTTVLDDMGYGGYLMWKYPGLDVAVHGYADVYTDEELRDIVAMGKVEPGWDDTVEETGAKVAFLSPRAPLTYALIHSLGWTVVHSSPSLVMLRAPRP